MSAPLAAVGAGLDKAGALLPGNWWAEAKLAAAGVGAQVGARATAELGRKLAPGWSVFGAGEATVSTGAPPEWGVGVGMRWTF